MLMYMLSGRPLIVVSGQGATATVWTPDLLQTLAQGRQVTIFTNKCLGLSVDSQETEATSIEGDSSKVDGQHGSIGHCPGPDFMELEVL